MNAWKFMQPYDSLPVVIGFPTAETIQQYLETFVVTSCGRVVEEH